MTNYKDNKGLVANQRKDQRIAMLAFYRDERPHCSSHIEAYEKTKELVERLYRDFPFPGLSESTEEQTNFDFGK